MPKGTRQSCGIAGGSLFGWRLFDLFMGPTHQRFDLTGTDTGDTQVRTIFASALLSLGIALAAPSASQAMMTEASMPAATNVIRVDYDIYHAPREGGAPLDWCVSYAHGCGLPAANRFCHQMGFSRAVRWRVYHPGQSYVPEGGNHYCNGPQCSALGDVECTY